MLEMQGESSLEDPWLTVKGKLSLSSIPKKATRPTSDFDMNEKQTFSMLSHELFLPKHSLV